jgi:hypothetical protein
MVRWLAWLALAGVTLAAPGRARAEPPAAGARWKPLRSASASATSFLHNTWNRYQENYHPSYVLDENAATAWVEGADGTGNNQSITLPLSPLSSARALRLRVWNGYQKTKQLFARNAMPRRVRIAVLDQAGAEVTTREHELARVWGPQELIVEVPPKRGLSAVRLTIVSVHPGTKYNDTCISDILVDVDSDVPHNAAAETGKLQALQAWAADRKAVAAYFAAKPAEFPFAFTQFAAKQQSFDVAEFKRRFAEGEALRHKLGPTRFKPVIKKPIRSAPDGLALLVLQEVNLDIDDFLQLFTVAEVALFETSEDIASHRRSEEGGLSESWTTSLRSGPGTGARIGLLAFTRRSMVRERTTSTSNRDLLLVYDDRGKLQRVYRDSQETPDFNYQWIRVWQMFSFSYDAAGKVNGIELLLHKSWLDNDDRKGQDRRATRVQFTGVSERNR